MSDNAADLSASGINCSLDKPMIFKPGLFVKFGSYPQNDGDTKEPIEWAVLEANVNEAFLVSRYGLDCWRYHCCGKHGTCTWEDCGLRFWLNNDFLKAAFSEDDLRRIKRSAVVNDDNPEYGTSGGNNTQDRIFCLSLAEAGRYFKNDGERQCRPTARAKAHGAKVIDDCCYWWLRSPGANLRCASIVNTDGTLQTIGRRLLNVNTVVRPALRLILNQ